MGIDCFKDMWIRVASWLIVLTMLFSAQVFAVAPNTPVISSPANGSSHNGGDYIAFEGTCTDTEDGPLSGAALAWTSSKDGAIGTGLNLSTNTLQSGVHTITLTATDSETLTSSANISITVGNNAPTSSITIPSNNSSFNWGAAITFSGSGTDIDQSDVLTYTWTSTFNSVTSTIGTGSVISVSTLAVGTHVIILTVSDGQGGSTPSTPITITINNNPPTATILSPNNNDTFYTGTSVSFNGSGSDPEDATPALTYNWSSNVLGTLSTSSSFSTNTLTAGYHTITFTVTDSNGDSNTVPQSIIIHIGNFDPVASIISPSTGTSYNIGQVIIFQGTGTDTEDGSLTGASLVWTSDLAGATPIGTGATFTSSSLQAGTHIITLTATDSFSTPGTGTDSVIISVNNTFPTATISNPADGSSYFFNTSVTFSGSGNDAEDGVISGTSLVWTSSLDGVLGNSSPFSTNTLSIGTHSITLTVTDSNGASTISTPITVTIGNEPPVAAITSPTDGSSFNRGDTITFRGTGTDTEDGSITGSDLAWTSSLDGALGTGTILPINTLVTGTHTITLTATDSQGVTGSATIAVTVNNNYPVVIINGPPDNSMYETGSTIAFSGTVTDAEDGFLTGASVVWVSSLDGILGNGSSLSTVLSKGTHTITLTGTDSEGDATTASIIVHVGNNPPTSTIISPATGTNFENGEYISFQGTSTDTEDGTLTGASLVWSSSIIGQFATGESPSPINTLPTGRHDITLIATDSNSAVTYSTPITIRVGNTIPVATILQPSDNTVFEAGQTAVFEGTGFDVEDGVLLGTALVWTSSRQGQIGTGTSLSMTNLASGQHTITLTVTDLDNATHSVSITIKAQNALPVAAIATPATNSSFDEGNNITFQGTGTDAEDGALTGSSLSWSSNLDGFIGTGSTLITDVLTSGTHTITLTATDNDGSPSTASITVVIVPMTLSDNTISIAQGTTGTITISGGKQPYRVATRRSSIAMPTENNGTITIEGISTGSTIVTVTDNNKKAQEINVTVTSSSAGTGSGSAPVADAGPDQSLVTENSVVYLTGSNISDPDNSETSFLWVQTDPVNPTESLSEPTVELSDPTSPTPHFIAPLVDLNGQTLAFQLTAISPGGSSTDTVIISLMDNGITDYPGDVVTFKSSTDRNMGAKVASNGILKILNAVAPSSADITTIPSNLIYGLIDMKITSVSTGGTAVVQIYLPEAAPDGYKWFKYIVSEDRWIDFDRELISGGSGDGAVFSSNREMVTLYITDDGRFDDNTSDGIIEDPSGLGLPQIIPNTTTGGGGDDDSGCFIRCSQP